MFGFSVRTGERCAYLGDIGYLTTDDKKVSFFDAAAVFETAVFSFERDYFPRATFDVGLNLLK